MANNSGGAALTTLTVSFSGSLASTSVDSGGTYGSNYASFLDGVQLLDSNGTDILTDIGSTTAEVASGTCVGSVACTVTWTIPSSTAQAQVTAGGTGLFKLRIDDQDGNPAVPETALSLSASIQATGDVQYYDSLDKSGILITGVPTNIVPMSIASFALPLGN